MKTKEKIFIALCFFAFIQPNFFVKINVLNYMSIGMALLCTLILLLRSFKKNVKFDITIFLLLLWRLLIFIPTLNHNGEIVKWGYQSVVFVGLYLLIKNYICDKDAFRIVYKMIFSYVLINILLMIIYPNGIFPQYGIYFLGIRTRFTEFSIALMYISLIYYNEYSSKNKKDRKKLITSYVLAIINILSKWVATGIVVIVLTILFYLLLRLLRNKKKLSLVYCFGFLILIALSINLINGNLLNLFSGLFELLNKDITLTGRTIIWENAIYVAKNYFLFGFGYVNDGNIISYHNGLWQAHNTILQSMCECGIFGTLTLFMMIFKQGFPNKIDNKKINSLNVAIIFSFLIMMMTEITYYYPIFIFIIFLIGNNYKKLGEIKDDK